ncbi:MAG: hypothetical protein CM1200mP29_11570 [Verrucomicrobiota bacterium]|nr:MAG: hypothetical protein CM1200mP29_11570 [Verrucomicrobiota bacterium]
MTIPNYISIFRLMLVPVFVISLLDFADTGAELSWWTAVGAFLVAVVSDGVDGYIARRFKQRSELGAFLDPMADKLLLVSGLVVLSFSSEHLPQLPVWMIGMVFGRDLFLLLGFFRDHSLVRQNEDPAALHQQVCNGTTDVRGGVGGVGQGRPVWPRDRLAVLVVPRGDGVHRHDVPDLFPGGGEAVEDGAG